MSSNYTAEGTLRNWLMRDREALLNPYTAAVAPKMRSEGPRDVESSAPFYISEEDDNQVTMLWEDGHLLVG